MPIYTKFGDRGTTTLLGGPAVPKDNPRVKAYGDVDELSTVLGIAMAFSEMKEVTDSLAKIQRDLFVIGSELASKTRKGKRITPARISEMENEIDKLEAKLPPLKNFILPGGSKTASLLHHARTVCRRAERSVVALSHKEKVSPETLTYLNRVGDLLFMQARFVNYKKKIAEAVWKGR